jgi:hypothetical protein
MGLIALTKYQAEMKTSSAMDDELALENDEMDMSDEHNAPHSPFSRQPPSMLKPMDIKDRNPSKTNIAGRKPIGASFLQQALFHFENALLYDEDDVRARTLLGWTYQHLGRTEMARGMLERATRGGRGGRACDAWISWYIHI